MQPRRPLVCSVCHRTGRYATDHPGKAGVEHGRRVHLLHIEAEGCGEALLQQVWKRAAIVDEVLRHGGGADEEDPVAAVIAVVDGLGGPEALAVGGQPLGTGDAGQVVADDDEGPVEVRP